MLLLHQLGAVKVGEVVRYTVTYTPTFDRILPPPTHLHVRIKNTSAIPLRAAYLHGPYTLYVACYPSTFDPNVKHDRHVEEGAPDYEPQLKAGGHWTTKLTIPEEIRTGVENGERNKEGERKNFTWIIEVASQVLFSTTAAVHYEVLVGRDEKSVVSGFSGAIQTGSGHGIPGKLEDLQARRPSPQPSAVQTKGVFSKAIRLAVDDTESLWNTPAFPSWDNADGDGGQIKVEEGPQHGDKRDTEAKTDRKQNKQKKIHLVILTHGIHSNVGADMLFMKESIDTAAKQAKEDAKQRKAELRAQQLQDTNEFGRSAQGLRSKSTPETVIAPTTQESDDEDEEEQILVRGFKGNCVKTEKGIQYLGKRLAKYVLSTTYPDQPYLPVKSSISKTIARSLTGQKPLEDHKGPPTHKHSSIIKDTKNTDHNLAYKITSISFISHSLGGLVQTYAVAYIQKHSPEFFDRIKPINFVAMASPFLGLSNENPVYVKFALDFGLVGRTGQDLGLTWRAPNIARTGWEAMVNGLVNDPHKDKQPDPGAKPLLRILPTGPAHQALKKFRNRTVYSNVVNDGIVPLRTSCLLFLDWRGLGRVEKARRENGLVGTMVNWGWSEMTGQNASTAKKGLSWNDLFSDSVDDSGKESDDPGASVPQASASQNLDFEQASHLHSRGLDSEASTDISNMTGDSQEQSSSPWTALLSYFRPQAGSKSNKTLPKSQRIYRRGQTMKVDDDDDDASDGPAKPDEDDRHVKKPRGPVRGSSLYNDSSDNESLTAPPKTTFFESAGDLLRPPLPSKEFILDPAARPRTIFHDRVYHPDDIPPPPVKRQRTFMRRTSSHETSVPNQSHEELNQISSSKPESIGQGSMKIEEKIARAYHKDMAWRKVLVRLEPDAHNNMIVRRMFANAYGWPVVKHMCDTHFAYTIAARTRDEDEDNEERAKPANEAVDSGGEQVKDQARPPDDEIVTGPVKEPSKSATFSTKGVHDRELDTTSGDNLLKTVHSKILDQENNRRLRTPSEVRESRDQVPDLVSMVTAQGQPSTSFGAMHSSTGPNVTSAAGILSRLHRQDSARWSDRFFEGDDEEDDEEDKGYLEELHKAQQRGEMIGTDKVHDTSNQTSNKSTSLQDNTVDVLGPTILDPKAPKLVQEPEELEPDDDIKSHAEQEDYDLTSVQSISATNVGLGKDVAEQVGLESPVKAQRRGSLGIAEQVAVAQTHDHDSEHDTTKKKVANPSQMQSSIDTGDRTKEDKT